MKDFVQWTAPSPLWESALSHNAAWMRAFQDQGHTGILIVGDYTARVGDLAHDVGRHAAALVGHLLQVVAERPDGADEAVPLLQQVVPGLAGFNALSPGM